MSRAPVMPFILPLVLLLALTGAGAAAPVDAMAQHRHDSHGPQTPSKPAPPPAGEPDHSQHAAPAPSSKMPDMPDMRDMPAPAADRQPPDARRSDAEPPRAAEPQDPPPPQTPQTPTSPTPPAAPHEHQHPPAAAPAPAPTQPEAQVPREPIPPVTDADRAAAFPPDVKGHHVHDNAVNSFVLVDQLEWQSGDGRAPAAGSWDVKGWIGKDKDRLWFRTEGEAADGGVEAAEAHLLYGRAIARWWDLVAGVRQDLRPGSPRTWGAVGVQGLAPYLFEVEATAYIGESGQVAARLELEYELLLTNRLILQPMIEANAYGASSPERGIGAGLSSTEAGLRLRYEFRREFAPYVGIVWHRKYGRTATLARESGGAASEARFTVGLRLWF